MKIEFGPVENQVGYAHRDHGTISITMEDVDGNELELTLDEAAAYDLKDEMERVVPEEGEEEKQEEGTPEEGTQESIPSAQLYQELTGEPKPTI